MRVLHLLHSLRRGGLERVVVTVANGLARRGVSQGVCCLHDAGPLIDALDPAVSRIVLSARPNDVTLPFALLRAYRSFDPDVIHTVDFCSWPDATLAALLRPRVGRLHTFHGFLEPPPARWRWVGKCLSRVTHTLQAVNPDTADQAAGYYGIPRERIDIIPNGVDVEWFDPTPRAAARQELGLVQDRFYCVTVASLTPAKNPVLLVEAARRAGADAHFIWVGDGPLRGQVADLIRQHDLGDRFLLQGAVDDVRPWLGAADAFVLPSLTEAAPLGVLEAMAMERPVVATRTGSLPDIVEPARAGLLAGSGDAAGVADCIRQLRETPEESRRMGVRGRTEVIQRFSVHRMLDRYQEVCFDLTGEAQVDGCLMPASVGG